MEQRDYIMREIEKISLMILGMLGRLRKVRDEKLFEQEREAVTKEFKSSTGLDINSVIKAGLNELEKTFSRDKGFDYRNMELMAELLVEFSSRMDIKERQQSVNKAVYLLELVNRESREFSFDRQARLNKLRDLL